MSKTTLTRSHLKFLLDTADALSQDDALENFVLLVAQNHPEVFVQTIDKIEKRDFALITTDELVQTVTNAVEIVEDTAAVIEYSGYKAILTPEQFAELKKIPGSQRNYAMRKLREFDTNFEARNNYGYAAYSWVGILPNIAAYGC